MIEASTQVSKDVDAYSAIPHTTISRKLYFPNIRKRTNGELNGRATAVTIQNLDTEGEANITLDYYGNTGEGCPDSIDHLGIQLTIEPGSNIIQNHRLPDGEPDLADGWCGSLVVTSSNKAIAGFVQLTDLDEHEGDALGTTRAIARD